MKPSKALTAIFLLGAILTTSTGCSDFVSAQEEPIQEISNTANQFYDVLEEDSNFDVYNNQANSIYNTTGEEHRSVISSLPGAEYLNISSADKVAGAYSFLDSNVSFIESRRYRYDTIVERQQSGKTDIPFRQVSITVPEDSITLINESKASIDTKAIIVTVDGETQMHDQYANKPIIMEKNADREWKISVSDEDSSKIW